MGKREKTPENSESENSAGSSSAEPAAPAAPRLSVQLDGSGAIDFERMRPDTRDKLRAAIERSGIAAPRAASSGPVVESLPPQMVEVIFDSVSMLLMGLAQRGGYTREQSAVLVYSPQEKAALVPAASKVLDKYNASLGKYQEEIMLGVLLVTITSGKLTMLRKSAQVINMAPRQSTGTESATSQAEN